jgi:hypothetical protein
MNQSVIIKDRAFNKFPNKLCFIHVLPRIVKSEDVTLSLVYHRSIVFGGCRVRVLDRRRL